LFFLSPYFSAANSLGQVSFDSKKIFIDLAESTITTWEKFFKTKIQYNAYDSTQSQDWNLKKYNQFLQNNMIVMINNVLMGSVTKLYTLHTGNDEGTMAVFDMKKNTLIIYDVVSGKPSLTVTDCKFTTIDAIADIEATKKGGARQLFCAVQPLGITKYFNATWQSNYTKYLERHAPMIIRPELTEGKTLK
jgi:hypothetical protein